MKPAVLFITGTDTGVGKTLFATFLARQLRGRGFRVAGLKPISAGGRADALALQAAAGNDLTLDEVNPWHFRASLAPLLAARREQRRVRLREVVKHIQRITQSFDVIVVEGAGGLLSPLGEGFNSGDLIRALRAVPVIVCANRLGAVNQALLALKALPRGAARRAHIVLVNLARATTASRTNLPLLRQLAARTPVHELPHLRQPASLPAALRRPLVRRTLDAVCGEIVNRRRSST